MTFRLQGKDDLAVRKGHDVAQGNELARALSAHDAADLSHTENIALLDRMGHNGVEASGTHGKGACSRRFPGRHGLVTHIDHTGVTGFIYMGKCCHSRSYLPKLHCGNVHTGQFRQ